MRIMTWRLNAILLSTAMRILAWRPMQANTSVLADAANTYAADRIASGVMDEGELCGAITTGNVKRIRYSGKRNIADRVRATAHLHGTVLIETSVAHHGMIELAWYFREQSLSSDYHRYGNLGNRSEEKRQMPR